MRNVMVLLALVLFGVATALPAAPVGPGDPSAAPAASADTADASHVAAIRARGTLVMLCWPHQESRYVRRMVELGAEGLNRFAGIDIDLMTAFANDLGVALEVKPIQDGFSSLLPTLLEGGGDLVASSMTITKGRAERVDFSVPYHGVRKVVVARADSDITGMADLAGKTAATVAGSSHEEHMQAMDGLRLHYADFLLETYQAVAYGEADFVLADSGSAKAVLPKYTSLDEKLKIAFVFPERDYYGVAVPPGSDLRTALNDFLDRQRAAGALEGLD